MGEQAAWMGGRQGEIVVERAQGKAGAPGFEVEEEMLTGRDKAKNGSLNFTCATRKITEVNA